MCDVNDLKVYSICMNVKVYVKEEKDVFLFCLYIFCLLRFVSFFLIKSNVLRELVYIKINI